MYMYACGGQNTWRLVLSFHHVFSRDKIQVITFGSKSPYLRPFTYFSFLYYGMCTVCCGVCVYMWVCVCMCMCMSVVCLCRHVCVCVMCLCRHMCTVCVCMCDVPVCMMCSCVWCVCRHVCTVCLWSQLSSSIFRFQDGTQFSRLSWQAPVCAGHLPSLQGTLFDIILSTLNLISSDSSWLDSSFPAYFPLRVWSPSFLLSPYFLWSYVLLTDSITVTRAIPMSYPMAVPQGQQSIVCDIG